jgi:LPS-assembly lipoprotein
MISSVVRTAKSGSQVVIYLVIAIGLVACGFQLRGSLNLSDEISPIYIEQNSVFMLAREIKTLLATNEIKVVKDEAQSKSALVLLNDSKQRRILSVDSSGRAKEYLLTYTVNFIIKLQSSTQPPVLPQDQPQDQPPGEEIDTLSVRRSLVFDPDAVLAVTNEAEILYKDMRRDVARLILLRLQARSQNAGGQGEVANPPEKAKTQ